jgi:hypothetical protein
VKLVTVSERVTPPASAPEPDVKVIPSSGSSVYGQLRCVRSIEIDTSLGEFSMTLIGTVSMKHLRVAKGVWSSQTFGNDVIDFPDVSIFEDESRVPAR